LQCGEARSVTTQFMSSRVFCGTIIYPKRVDDASMRTRTTTRRDTAPDDRDGFGRAPLSCFVWRFERASWIGLWCSKIFELSQRSCDSFLYKATNCRASPSCSHVAQHPFNRVSSVLGSIRRAARRHISASPKRRPDEVQGSAHPLEPWWANSLPTRPVSTV
jgi:hypothetical protein